MAEKVVGGLKWVKGEIAMTLRRVRGLVEAFARSGEPAELTEAVDALFEVRGVLLALQLSLPARLADEMQRLCDAMAEHRVPSPRESIEALLLALIQLPSHLDQLDAGSEVPPLSLWPTINDLRASRGAPPVTPAELLVPGSVLVAEEEDPPPEALEALAVALRKVRPHFHRHLVEYFGQASSAEGLVKLSRLFQQLHRFLKEGMLADLFRLAAAHAAGLQRGQVAGDGGARALIGRLDRVFKPLVGAIPSWPEAEIRELLDAYLIELDQTDIQPALVAEVRAHYARSVLELALLPASAGVLGGLAETMLGEIAMLKECLAQFVRGERDDRTPLAALRLGTRRLAHALEEAGSTDVAERLRRLAEGFGDLMHCDAAEDGERLEPLVGALLEIETLFQAQARTPMPAAWSDRGDRLADAGTGGAAAPPAAPPGLGAPLEPPLIESAERWVESLDGGVDPVPGRWPAGPAAVPDSPSRRNPDPRVDLPPVASPPRTPPPSPVAAAPGQAGVRPAPESAVEVSAAALAAELAVALGGGGAAPGAADLAWAAADSTEAPGPLPVLDGAGAALGADLDDPGLLVASADLVAPLPRLDLPPAPWDPALPGPTTVPAPALPDLAPADPALATPVTAPGKAEASVPPPMPGVPSDAAGTGRPDPWALVQSADDFQEWPLPGASPAAPPGGDRPGRRSGSDGA